MALPCMTSSIAGMQANMTGLNVVGNNISNVNTGSFKSSSVTFRDAMYQEINGGSAGSANGAGTNPSQLGYGATASSIDVNFTKGSPNPTGKASDVYIDGDGFFIVGDGGGTVDSIGAGTESTYKFGGYKYTRLGSLSFDSNGYLTDGAGNYVCGLVNTATNMAVPPVYTAGQALQALREPTTTVSGVTTVHPIDNLAIGADGTISCNDQGTSRILGKIEIAKFTNASGMRQLGNGFYAATQNAGNLTVADPNSKGTGKLLTGELEASNVDVATEFANMIIFERGYQSNTKMISVADECLQTLVNMK